MPKVSDVIFPQWAGKDFSKKYKQEKKLGQGGFATVYQVSLVGDPKKKFAAKFQVRPVEKRQENNIKAEVEIMMKIKHEHAIRFIEGFETKQHIILVMELCTGGDMFEHIVKNKRMGEQDVKEALKQVLEVLQEAHSQGVVHCDLKLENIIYANSNNDSIRVVDFGLSKNKERFRWLSKVGGTAMYIAPECLTQAYTESIDIWAVGILAFEMMHGYVPFCNQGRTAVQTIKAAKKGFVNEIKRGRGPWWNKKIKVSRTGRKFILDCLVTDPSKRLTAKEALMHPWFKELSDNCMYSELIVELRKKRNMCKIKKFAKYMCDVDSLHHWMIKDIKEVLYRYDKSGNHRLSAADFQASMKEIVNDGTKLISDDQINNLFGAVDETGEQAIDIDEFLQAYAFQYFTSQDDRIWNLIQQLDVGGDGKICIDDVQKYLKENLGTKKCVFEKGLDDDTLKAVLNLLNKGPLTIEEFVFNIC